MNAFLIEAIPASALGSFAIAFEILFAVVNCRVMFAGHVMNLLLLRSFEHLVHGVVLSGLGQMAEVAGMNDEVGRLRKRIDLVDCCLQRADHIGVGWFVETNVAVANLNETESRFGAGSAEGARTRDPAADGPDYTCSGPGHALQEAATVDAVVVMVVNNSFGQRLLLLG